MIFEPCGDHVEPKRTIIEKATTTNNLKYSNKSSKFWEQNQDEESLHCDQYYFADSNIEDQRVPAGFRLNEEEWSMFKQHNLGLEAYERKKMGSLPKSFTPFSLTTGGVETNGKCNGNDVSDSIWLRKCESLNSTPSQYFFNGNEPNNNSNGIHPLPLSKLILFNPKGSDIFQEEEEKENWGGEGGWLKGSEDPSDSTSVSLNNSINNNTSPVRCNFFWNNVCNSLSDQEMGKEGDYDSILNGLSFSTVGSTPTTSNLISSSPIQNISISPVVLKSDTSPDTVEIASTENSRTKLPFPKESVNENDYNSSFCQYQEWKYKLSQWDDDTRQYENKINKVETETRPSVEEPLYVNVSFKESAVNNVKYVDKEINDVGKSNETEQQPKEEMDTLLTFLSKFDEKVAAIWGQEGDGNQFSGLSGFSSQNTPVVSVGGGSSNPWGSPTNNPYSPSSEDSHHQPSLFDFRAMQRQLQYQQQPIAGSSTSDTMFRHGRKQPNASKSNRLAIGGNRPSPPKGKHTIMHSMREYFGTAPPESDYHIIRRVDFPESEEEIQKSLSTLNHSGSSSNFIQFVADLAWPNDGGNDSDDSFGNVDFTGGMGMLSEYELDGEDELEIVVACSKPKRKPLIQAPQEDLLNSWKTHRKQAHFRTIVSMEAKGYTECAQNVDDSNNQRSSPINSSGLSAHQINPHLPHFRPFNGNENDYNLFSKRPCDNKYFPVRFKLCRENEKGNQTADGEDLFEFSYQQQDHILGGFDWEGYLPSQPLFPASLVSQDSQHSPLDPSTIFDYDNALQLSSSNWHTGEKPVGAEMDLDYLESQSEYYDDIYADYEGDYEFMVGGTSGGVAGTSGISTYNLLSTSNENDTDFGHFQSFGFQSVVSGKQAKANRRRARIRPCKYYFLEGSCRRGNDCKFSHDLITITCRYWAEGSCLKGSSCPFLHCFLDSKEMGVQGEFGASSLAQDKKYQLESESDFPALGSTNANAMISSRVPMSMGFPTSGGEGDGVGLLGQCTDESYENLMIFLTSPPVATAEEDVSRRKNGLFLFERMSSPFEADPAVSTSISEQVVSSGMPISQSNVMKNTQHRPNSQNTHGGRGKSEGPGEGSVRSTAISKSNSHNSNNWICSMISVKEKRKKKKH